MAIVRVSRYRNGGPNRLDGTYVLFFTPKGFSHANCNIVCLLAGVPIAKASANAQIPWLEAIEERLASTVKCLGAMKGIRITGLADIISAQITDLRMAEIRASWRHRFLNVFIFVLSKSVSDG